MKLLSGKNASPAQELKLECAGCHFPLRNFSFCFYMIFRGFAFSHVLRRNVARGGFFFLHRRCSATRICSHLTVFTKVIYTKSSEERLFFTNPCGKIKPKNKRRVLTLSQITTTRQTGGLLQAYKARFPS